MYCFIYPRFSAKITNLKCIFYPIRRGGGGGGTPFESVFECHEVMFYKICDYKNNRFGIRFCLSGNIILLCDEYIQVWKKMENNGYVHIFGQVGFKRMFACPHAFLYQPLFR